MQRLTCLFYCTITKKKKRTLKIAQFQFFSIVYSTIKIYNLSSKKHVNRKIKKLWFWKARVKNKPQKVAIQIGYIAKGLTTWHKVVNCSKNTFTSFCSFGICPTTNCRKMFRACDYINAIYVITGCVLSCSAKKNDLRRDNKCKGFLPSSWHYLSF